MEVKRIKTAMAAKGLNQRDLARALGTSEAAVTRYLRHERVPSAPVLIRMAKVLGLSVDYILGLTDDRTRPVTLIVAKPFGDFMAFKTVQAKINNVEIDGTVVGVEF